MNRTFWWSVYSKRLVQRRRSNCIHLCFSLRGPGRLFLLIIRGPVVKLRRREGSERPASNASSIWQPAQTKEWKVGWWVSVNLLVYSGFRLFKTIAIWSSSEVSLFLSNFVMHSVPLYLSISGHLKPYGSLTLGYRERFSRSATSYLSPLNLLT